MVFPVLNLSKLMSTGKICYSFKYAVTSITQNNMTPPFTEYHSTCLIVESWQFAQEYLRPCHVSIIGFLGKHSQRT